MFATVVLVALFVPFILTSPIEIEQNPLQCREGAKTPSAFDCAIYYECIRGSNIERRCDIGYHFNRLEETCDLPHIAQCPIRSTTTTLRPPTSTTRRTTTTTRRTTTTTRHTTRRTTRRKPRNDDNSASDETY